MFAACVNKQMTVSLTLSTPAWIYFHHSFFCAVWPFIHMQTDFSVIKQELLEKSLLLLPCGQETRVFFGGSFFVWHHLFCAALVCVILSPKQLINGRYNRNSATSDLSKGIYSSITVEERDVRWLFLAFYKLYIPVSYSQVAQLYCQPTCCVIVVVVVVVALEPSLVIYSL